MELLVLSLVLTLVLLVFALITKQIEKSRAVKGRIDSHIELRDPDENIAFIKKTEDSRSKIKGGIRGIAKKLRKYYNDIAPTQKEDELQEKLLRAGSPFRMTVADYYITKNIIRVFVPLLFGAFALVLKLSVIQVMLIIIIGFLFSYKALDLYLGIKTKDRYKKALKELPDFLDILTISVEAGLGFDLALSKTIEKREGILPLEFHTCLEEMRLGKTRKDALLGIKARLAFDEMVSFVNSIIQSEKLGTGIVNTLRTKSEDERDKRKQRAEEAAMKTTIKILLPLVLFIFPSIFIIVFGPAAIQLMKSLGSGIL